MRAHTTYAIYWLPAGYSVSANYESLIDGFLQNVGAASGHSDNVYSVATQYGDTTGAGNYASSFGGSVIDTDPFPASGCTDGPLAVCLTDAQLQAEIDNVIAAHGWPTGLSREFFVFTPLQVGSCFDSSSSTCAYSYYCAYHSSFTSGTGTVLYADEPYAALPAAGSACDTGERPNGDDADATINLVSHEHIESITDPLLSAWYDQAGFEIGDKCAWRFGQPLGSTGGSGTDTDYNEQIGTGEYYLQEEWSNQTYDASSGEPGSCVQRDVAQLVLTGPGGGRVTGNSGVDCTNAVCDMSAVVGKTETFTAHPATGSSFVGWQGHCSGTETCTATIGPNASVVARFETSDLPTGWAEEPLLPPAGAESLVQSIDPEWGFFRLTEAANGDERAITVSNANGSCSSNAPTGLGGIFLQRQTASGWTPDGTLSAPAVGTGDWRYWPSCFDFGAEISLSADGSTLLTSQTMDQVGTNDFRCAAFVYERGATGWSLAQTLFPPGIGSAGSPTWDGCDYFGINSTLSADGRRAVVLSSGRVDVFVRGSSGWALEQHLVLPAGDNCYSTIGPPRLAISSDGSRLLVGAPDCAISGQLYAGRVYDYERSGPAWSLAQTIDAPETAFETDFGLNLSLSGDGKTAAIGATTSAGLPSFAGAVWIYEHDSGGWQQRVRLTTPSPGQYGLFACPHVSDDGSQLLCTAFDTVGLDPAQGSMYAFQRPGASWTTAPTPARFYAGDGYTGDNLGAGHEAVTWFRPNAVTASASGGDIATTIAAQNVGLYSDGRIGYEFTTGPVIRSFGPSRALAGTKVTIRGANFDAATGVKFSGVDATSFTVDSPTEITATVPPAATVGTIGVTTSKGRGWSTSTFSPLPAIQSFTPVSGTADTRVTITGTNLLGASAVMFGGVTAAAFSVTSATQVTATVPATATAGELTLVTPGGNASSSTAFEPVPAITSFSPARAVARTRVLIRGTNLFGASNVRFAGRNAHFVVISPTRISARVPKLAGRGRLTVTTADGRGVSSRAFKPLPSIGSFLPRRARAGTRITIRGANLGGATSVRFRGRRARFRVLSPTRIVAIVPRRVTSGRISVRTRAGEGTSRVRFRVRRRVR